MNGQAEGAGAVAVTAPDPMLAAAASAAPHIAQLNVSQKSQMHIGPKFVSVTQNVHSVEVVKGRALGLELQASARAPRRLRCSVAVCVCWALLVAGALAAGLLCLLLLQHPVLIDLETSLCRYVWEWAQRTSRAERLAFAVALAALVVCATLLAVVLSRADHTLRRPDVAPHPWNITRGMWLAKERPAPPDPLEAGFVPPRLVIVQHTTGPECHVFAECAAVMRHLQDWYIHDYKMDIPYNFQVGNDGRVYEGRGWGVFGAHTRFYNRCSIGLGFTGDYRTALEKGSRVTKAQLDNTLLLLSWGVAAGYLHEDYVVVGAKDVQSSQSPGDNLYAALRTWDHFAKTPEAFFNETCEYIYENLLEPTRVATTVQP